MKLTIIFSSGDPVSRSRVEVAIFKATPISYQYGQTSSRSAATVSASPLSAENNIIILCRTALY